MKVSESDIIGAQKLVLIAASIESDKTKSSIIFFKINSETITVQTNLQSNQSHHIQCTLRNYL